MNKNPIRVNRRKATSQLNKYYRILQPQNPQKVQSQELDKVSREMIKSNRFLYIDMLHERGFQYMQEIDDSDSGEETEQLGNHYVTQLDNSSERNSRAVSYLFEMKQESRRKSQAKEMVSEELKRSHQKLKRSGVRKRNRFSVLSEVQPREHVYHRMDDSALESIRLKDENQELDRVLIKREEGLLKYYNTIATHCPKLKAKPMKRQHQSRMNSFLPDLAAFRLGKR